MTNTIDTKFWLDGRHYRLEVLDDDKVRVRLRCQRRWYVVGSGRLSKKGTPTGTFPWELRGIVKKAIAAHVVGREAGLAAA